MKETKSDKLRSNFSTAIPAKALAVTDIRIRLGEFDLGGVLYHANYFHLFEELREQMLELAGHPYCELVAAGSHLIISESEIKFLKPITYGMKISAWCWASAMTSARIDVRYLLKNSSDEELCQATTRHAFVTNSNGTFRPSRIPKDLRQALAIYTDY